MTTTGYQNGHREKRAPMTPEEATRFGHRSALNAAIVASALPCGCEPYQDVFTFNRWLAQGLAVQKGQHAVKLAVLKEVDEVDDDGPTGRTIRVRAGAAVFCRHQVAPVAPLGERENRGKQRVPREGGQRKSGHAAPWPGPYYPSCAKPGHLFCGALRCPGERARDCNHGPEEAPKLALALSYGSTVIGHDGPAKTNEPDNAAVDALMAGFEVLA